MREAERTRFRENQFHGQYEAVIDAWGRVRVPGHYRKQILGGSIISDFTLDEARCLKVSPAFNAEDCHLDKARGLKFPGFIATMPGWSAKSSSSAWRELSWRPFEGPGLDG